MAFMQREITEKQSWFMLDGNNGTEMIPVDVLNKPWYYITMQVGEGYNSDHPAFAPFCAAIYPFTTHTEIDSVILVEGYGARLSAPGCLDCTEWAVFDTIEEAQTYLDETYPEEEEV